MSTKPETDSDTTKDALADRLAAPPSDSDAKPPPGPDFPEGGLQAWLTVLGAFIFQFATFGVVNSFGVFNDFYVRIYLKGNSTSDIAWIGSVQVFAVLSMSIATGRMFDRGLFHHLMIFGSLLFTFCYFMLSLSKPNHYYQVFLSHGLGVGLGTGIGYLPSLGIAAHYFQKKRPLIMGVISAGAPLGAVIHPIMLNKLFFGSLGFNDAVRASAGLNGGLLIIANLMVRTRLPGRAKGPLVDVKSFFKDIHYVFALGGGFLVLISLFVPIFFIQLDDIQHGVDRNFAFYSVSILQAASFWGRIIPQLFIPMTGLFNLQLVSTAASMILVFCMVAVKDIGGTIPFAILYGFFSGATISLVPPLFATFARSFGEIGVRMGLGIFLGGVGALIGSPIAGALLTKHFVWWRPIVFSGVILAAATFCFFVSRFGAVKKAGSQRA